MSALVVRRAALAALVTIVALGAAACAGCDRAGPLPVRKVLVDIEPAARAIDREEVRRVVDEVLKKARGVALVDPGTQGAVLRVRVDGYGPAAGEDVEREDGGAPRSTLALTVEVTAVPNDATAATTGYRGHALASGAGITDARTLVGQALRDALAQVLMTRNAADLDSKELIAWLDADGPEGSSDEQKRRAVRILGSRRERAAVEPLARVLMGDAQELQPLALAALTNIGDPGAVDAVIAYSDRQPSVVKKQCIEAVRSMGSPRGKAWLFTLSTGHPDADVQQQAAAALAALEGEALADGPGRHPGAVAERAPAGPPVEATP